MGTYPVDPAEFEAGGLSERGLRPSDWVTVFFCLFLSAMVLLHFSRIPSARSHLAIEALVILALVAASRFPIRSGPKAVSFFRLWYPIALIPLLFGHLVEIIPAATQGDHDKLLIQIDLFLFGGHPSVLTGAIATPILTELLMYVYALFYFIPLSLSIVLVWKRELELYDIFRFLVCYGFFFSYLGYFLIPAVGPRFTIASQYAEPLTGVLLYRFLVDFLNFLESVNRDCFPSGHTMMTLATLHFAWHHARKVFWALLPGGVALIFSTIYLRYHYGIDLLAAVVFYLFVIYSTPYLYRMLRRLSGPVRARADRPVTPPGPPVQSETAGAANESLD